MIKKIAVVVALLSIIPFSSTSATTLSATATGYDENTQYSAVLAKFERLYPGVDGVSVICHSIRTFPVNMYSCTAWARV